jgi:hypothetical protein
MSDWKTVRVKGLDKLVEAMERADDKGYLPDAIREEWDAFMLDIADGGKGEAARTHTTQPGESVMGIALRQCGDENEWRHILACNPKFADLLPSDYFPVGTVLTLPTAPQAECAPREAQPDGWPMLKPLHLEALMFAYNEGYSKAYDGREFANPFTEAGSQAAAWALGTRDGKESRERSAAPTPERADADTAGAAEYIGPHGLALLDAMASQERADAGKDAALTDDLIGLLADKHHIFGTVDQLGKFARAILAANKEPK